MDRITGRLDSLKSRASQQERRIRTTLNLWNTTGSTLTPHEVVVLNPSVSNAVRYAPAASAQAPLVTITSADNDDRVKCTHRGYGKISIQCDGPAITPGDAIVASSTPGCGRVNNAATIRNFLGFALEPKAVGITTYIEILI